ncbi:TPA: fimbrial protein [Salmonella enterica subsp. enterica serovar Brandenburg]
MRFSKITIITIGLVVAGMFSPVYAASSARATLIIDATFTKPSCTISAPSSYDLGELVRGQVKEHEPLLINIECPGSQSAKTALTAKVLTGKLENTQDKVRMMVDGKENGTLLSLKPVDAKASVPIKLTGLAQDAFCNINDGQFRQCQLIPVTEVHTGDTPGHASAALQFEVVYP